MNRKPVLLLILDGLGVSPLTKGNALYQASTPVFDNLIKTYPTCLLTASGAKVGLEWDEMGNSEVGHFNLGSGRVVEPDFTRINKAISDGSFFKNEALAEIVNYVKKHHSTLHLAGLLSNGAVNTHIDHIKALLDFAHKEKIGRLALHLFTDGRDGASRIAPNLLDIINDKIESLEEKNWCIATTVGRFYGMDQNKHWDRTQVAYDLMTKGVGQQFFSYHEALSSSYNNKVYDEEIKPIIFNSNYLVKDNDGLLFFNFKRDRVCQLAQSFIDPNFKAFKRKTIAKNLFFVGFVNYGEEPNSLVRFAFFPNKAKNSLAQVLATKKIKNLRIAETEKYAHVTHFFNGGAETPYNFEDRILVPSQKVNSLAGKPEMSAKLVSEKLIKYLINKKPLFTVCNLANPDMVGHTGNFPATVKAVEVIDLCLGKIFSSLSDKNFTIVVVADHGNAEQMINPKTHDVDKEHTANPVPFILAESIKNFPQVNQFKSNRQTKLALAHKSTNGELSDVNATILSLLNLKKPNEVSGVNLKDKI